MFRAVERNRGSVGMGKRTRKGVLCTLTDGLGTRKDFFFLCLEEISTGYFCLFSRTSDVRI